jgi:hypothetical protein
MNLLREHPKQLLPEPPVHHHMLCEQIAELDATKLAQRPLYDVSYIILFQLVGNAFVIFFRALANSIDSR